MLTMLTAVCYRCLPLHFNFLNKTHEIFLGKDVYFRQKGVLECVNVFQKTDNKLLNYV